MGISVNDGKITCHHWETGANVDATTIGIAFTGETFHLRPLNCDLRLAYIFFVEALSSEKNVVSHGLKSAVVAVRQLIIISLQSRSWTNALGGDHTKPHETCVQPGS